MQLMRLVPAFDLHDIAFVTVQAEYQAQVAGRRFHLVRDATSWERWGLVVLSFQLVKVMLKERPRVVLTTGAAPGLLALFLARLIGARTIWIDSIANVATISKSGKLAGSIADHWVTQWEHLAKPDGPRYEGSVL